MRAKFEFVVDHVKFFNNLKEAKEYANRNNSLEIGLAKYNLYDALFRYHPMSERLEQICTLREAKKRMNELLKMKVN